MKLSEVLPESAICLNMDGLDKWAVIEALADSLVESGQVAPEARDGVHAALVARENSMSTGMESGLAIPHSSIELVERTVVALGIAREGLDFDAIDGKPTHLIMLLVNPADRTKTHIRTLAEIARLLSSDELRADLRSAETPHDALMRIRAAEAAVT